jgi:hypothetical protein
MRQHAAIDERKRTPRYDHETGGKQRGYDGQAEQADGPQHTERGDIEGDGSGQTVYDGIAQRREGSTAEGTYDRRAECDVRGGRCEDERGGRRGRGEL